MLSLDYSTTSYQHDISLLKLRTNLTLNTNIQVITYPQQNDEVAVGTSCFITGWGTSKYRFDWCLVLCIFWRQNNGIKVVHILLWLIVRRMSHNKTYTTSIPLFCRLNLALESCRRTELFDNIIQWNSAPPTSAQLTTRYSRHFF